MWLALLSKKLGATDSSKVRHFKPVLCYLQFKYNYVLSIRLTSRPVISKAEAKKN